MKQIVFFIFLCLTAHLTASDKNDSLADLLQSFGDNGEYDRMDSIYGVITRENRYEQDKLYALDIDLDYARYLNQKGDCDKAYTLLAQTRKRLLHWESTCRTSPPVPKYRQSRHLLRTKLPTDNGRPTT